MIGEGTADSGAPALLLRGAKGGLQGLLLLLVVLLFPLSILVIGLPIAFVVRVALELFERL